MNARSDFADDWRPTARDGFKVTCTSKSLHNAGWSDYNLVTTKSFLAQKPDLAESLAKEIRSRFPRAEDRVHEHHGMAFVAAAAPARTPWNSHLRAHGHRTSLAPACP